MGDILNKIFWGGAGTKKTQIFITLIFSFHILSCSLRDPATQPLHNSYIHVTSKKNMYLFIKDFQNIYGNGTISTSIFFGKKSPMFTF